MVTSHLPPCDPALTSSCSPQVWGANHSLVFGILPVASFASGHTFFVQRLFEFQQVKPYVVHTTYQVRSPSSAP